MILFICSYDHEDCSGLVTEEINPQALSKSYTPDFKELLTDWINFVTRTHYNAEEGEDQIHYGQTLRIDGQDGFYVHINNDECTVLSVPKTPPPMQATVGQFITPTISTKKRKK